MFIVSLVICSCSGLRLLTYNIRNAKGMDNKVDYDRIAVVIRNAHADVIALQELDSATRRSNKEDVLKTLAGKTGLFGIYAAAISFQEGRYGVGILSKQKPLNHYTIPLPGKEEQRVLLVAEFEHCVIFCTHLSLTEADRLTSVAIINEQANKFTKTIYLLGDLNAEPNSNVLSALKEKWILLSGEGSTFPSASPEKCIDYILVLNNKKVKVLSKNVINEPMASDHRPVLVQVNQK